jgi:hypothetical protein
VPGLPADFQGPGTYTIPAAPAAPFALSSVRIEQGGGTVSVYYDLPAGLVGQKQRVDLTGTAEGTETILLVGTAGTSACTVSPGELRCEEHLSGVHVDAALATSELPSGDPQRAAVQAFSVDPIGVLAVALPPTGSDDGATGNPSTP